ncbi:hypothetical protein Tco_0680913 [Tanacetum coccineum]|uniref:Uncharacterized protein n=1 Tax=Tanacetum coccineum TaxID=301880 RepID=A0ABQ4XLU0_9ASTR
MIEKVVMLVRGYSYYLLKFDSLLLLAQGYTVSTASILNAANEKFVPSKERFNCQSILQLPRTMVITAFIVFISGVCIKFLVYAAWFQVLKVSYVRNSKYWHIFWYVDLEWDMCSIYISAAIILISKEGLPVSANKCG